MVDDKRVLIVSAVCILLTACIYVAMPVILVMLWFLACVTGVLAFSVLAFVGLYLFLRWFLKLLP